MNRANATRVSGATDHDGRVGALVTLDLPDDSPMLGLPWIITFGPLGDIDEWEPVVCGPYERLHALALAEAVVAEEELMAVVEPLLPAVSAEEIRGEIVAAQVAAEDETARMEGPISTATSRTPSTRSWRRPPHRTTTRSRSPRPPRPSCGPASSASPRSSPAGPVEPIRPGGRFQTDAGAPGADSGERRRHLTPHHKGSMARPPVGAGHNGRPGR